MKTKQNYLLLATLAGGILFNLIFWSERLAINLLLYSIFILTVTFFNREVAKSIRFKLYAAAHLIAALLVVINNSDLSIATYYISFLLFVGYSHYQGIRSVWVAFMATVIQILAIPATVLQRLSHLQIGKFKIRPIIRPLKYIIIPLIIVMIFVGIYSGANPVFGSFTDAIANSIGTSFSKVFGFIFKDLSIGRFVHLCLGIALTGGLLLTFFNPILEKMESKLNETLFRKKNNNIVKTLWSEISHIFMGQIISKKLALKTEYIIAVISFIALNFILFILNGIDIWWLWLGQGKNLAETNYAADLHDGTNALIFSIVLAMAVIIFFFRGNLNFYAQSKTLKKLAFIWMIQNFLLVISVLIRDAHYINFYGITHKRIGVIVFALLCIIGLFTVYLKVSKQKTFFYLLKVNGNIWFAMLLLFSTINWDIFIAKYNLAQSDVISLDADYLLSLSDKTLPILDKNSAKLRFTEAKNTSSRIYTSPQTAAFYQKLLDERIGYFKDRYKKVSWLSFNQPDWNAANYFGIKH